MKRTILIRFGVGTFVLFLILAALLEISRDDEIGIRPMPMTAKSTDPLSDELRRCQTLGDAALADPSCLHLWAESRRDFLRSDPSSEEDE
ncbi:MAG: putative entry exclusion protein TrbK-alt [Alphaproteobacteria bacterium]